MSVIVVDASVLAKWFFPEVHASAARRLRDARYELHAPDFALLELANLYGKKVRRGELTAEEAAAVLDLTHALPVRQHRWQGILDPAFGLSLETSRSLYDCLYLALALSLGGSVVTADRKLYDALQAGPHASHLLWVEAIPA